MIDVSQSVEHDHPHALEFLRRDCCNVNGKHMLNLAYAHMISVTFLFVCFLIAG